MIQSALLQSHRNFSLILICAMLGACATTQKSSTGSGDQAAAPISKAANPQTTAKPGETPNSPASGAAGAPAKSNSNSAKSAGAASGNTGAKQGSSESSAASSDNDEAAQLKRQFAEQDEQINKLRNDQQADAAREEAVAKQKEEEAVAKQKETDAAKPPDQPSAAAATERPASPVAATKAGDEIAVFASNGNAAGNSGSQPAVQRSVERSVYFGYDQATVADKYDAMLMANAAYLEAHPAVRAEVQGNCDERGSREYNLALGARRAQSVKRALELAGADGSRISAISFGSEKPVATGKDEESYSQNRRADIVY
jgi:peptidoglycan-associated lipoprotein